MVLTGFSFLLFFQGKNKVGYPASGQAGRYCNGIPTPTFILFIPSGANLQKYNPEVSDFPHPRQVPSDRKMLL